MLAWEKIPLTDSCGGRMIERIRSGTSCSKCMTQLGVWLAISSDRIKCYHICSNHSANITQTHIDLCLLTSSHNREHCLSQTPMNLWDAWLNRVHDSIRPINFLITFYSRSLAVCRWINFLMLVFTKNALSEVHNNIRPIPVLLLLIKIPVTLAVGCTWQFKNSYLYQLFKDSYLN